MRVKRSLDALPPFFRKWNKVVFGNIEKKIEEARVNLENHHKFTLNEEILDAIRKEEINLDN